ncbi:hypothetical protein [uncultured Lutibacter sp.]|uniref:hypothetical protein n=1 Tax=uncultured Lutibacter sp. TaxID=437739 RepID=UPI00260C0671|nr:hypothetical protein [uncultured Lutibacter sp.]
MKTKIFIALLMISTITFAQTKKQQIIKTESSSKVYYMKIDDIKGESNDTYTKRTIKIGGAEKHYARFQNENNQNSSKWWANNKMKDAEAKNSNVQRRRGDVKIEDIDVSKKN